MDPATAALMSDPDRNPLFCRRWQDGDDRVVSRPVARNDNPWTDLDGLDLLQAWRRERERRA